MAVKYVLNIILMKNWTGFWSCSSRCLSTVFFFSCFSFSLQAQSLKAHHQHQANYYRYYSLSSFNRDTTVQRDSSAAGSKQKFPNPKSVMYKSLIIPGWGQVINKQIWKVPLIYGLLGGLAWYSVYLTKTYHDYRAAYYNLNPNTPEDNRFGPTPSYIPENASLEAIRTTRNSLRNRRDFIYITIGLAYGLNVIDAYVYAHMRSFDVSEDLSMRPTFKPAILAEGNPGVTLSLELFNKTGR